MQTYISSSSPLLSYFPCRGCDTCQGFDSGAAFFGTNTTTGDDTGMVTTATRNTTVAVNFTGTGISFDLTFSNKASWMTAITVNSTAPPTSSMSNELSVTALPYGLHQIKLTISPTFTSTSANSSSSEWARVNGILGDLGVMIGNATTNVTIDDTAWRSGCVILTPAWNMLERNDSNWINSTEFFAELETSNRDFNESISWTDQYHAATTIEFTGEAVWVYGIVGGSSDEALISAGTYQVWLDKVHQGDFNAAAADRVYQQVLFHASGLNSTHHELELKNLAGRLSFDRLVALDRLVPAATLGNSPTKNSTFGGGTVNGTIMGGNKGGNVTTSKSSTAVSPPVTTTTPVSTASAEQIVGSGRAKLVIVPIIVISVIAGTVAVVAIGAMTWYMWFWRKNGPRIAKWVVDHPIDSPDEKRWTSRLSTMREKIRPFVTLFNDSPGPVMTNFATSRPLHEGSPRVNFPTPHSSFGASLPLDHRVDSSLPPLPPPSLERFESPGSPSSASSSFLRISAPPKKKSKVSNEGGSGVRGRSISHPRPRGGGDPEMSVCLLADGGESRYIEMSRAKGGAMAVAEMFGSSGGGEYRAGLGEVLRRGSVVNAMDAAVSGTHSPLTALQRNAKQKREPRSTPVTFNQISTFNSDSLGLEPIGDLQRARSKGFQFDLKDASEEDASLRSRPETFSFLSAYGLSRESKDARNDVMVERGICQGQQVPRNPDDRAIIGLAISAPGDHELHFGRESGVSSRTVLGDSFYGAGGLMNGGGGRRADKRTSIGDGKLIVPPRGDVGETGISRRLGGDSIIPQLEPERSPRRRLFGGQTSIGTRGGGSAAPKETYW